MANASAAVWDATTASAFASGTTTDTMVMALGTKPYNPLETVATEINFKPPA